MLLQMKFLFLFTITLMVLFIPTKEVHSHGGGLTSDGCHFNHKLGTRHCHRGKDGSPTNDVNISGAKVYVYNPDLLGNSHGAYGSNRVGRPSNIKRDRPEAGKIICPCFGRV